MAKEDLQNSEKWRISFVSALVFALISAPFTYRLTGNLFGRLGLDIQQNGCPNNVGLLLHALVFMVVIRLMMQ